MFPGAMESIVNERHENFLQEAERMRLIATIRRQQPDQEEVSRKVTNWLGGQMVTWGLKLQGGRVAPPSQVAVAGATDAGCSKN